MEFRSSRRLEGTDNYRRLSYIPLIAPSTSKPRIKILSSIADSFIYVVSKVGLLAFHDLRVTEFGYLDGNDWLISRSCYER